MDSTDHRRDSTCPPEAESASLSPDEKSQWVMEIKGETDILLRRQIGESSSEDNDIRFQNLQEAVNFLKTPQITDQRTMIRLLFCENHLIPAPDLQTFLQEVTKLREKHEITLSGCNIPEGIQESFEFAKSTRGSIELIEDESISKRKSSPGERQEEFEIKAFNSSRNSPLPELDLDRFDPMKDEIDLVRQPKILDVHALALIDWDGTLWQTEPKEEIVLLQFMHFVREHNASGFRIGQGKLDALEQAISFCEEWAEIRRKKESQKLDVVDDHKYHERIIISDDRSAAGFEGMYLRDLQAMADEFGPNHMHGKFFKFAHAIPQIVRDYGALPFLETGAPHVLVRSLLKKSGLTHGRGLMYDVKNGKLTGRVEYYKKGDEEKAIHMGISQGKSRQAHNLVSKGYGILWGIGNETGDIGLIDSAIRRMPGRKWDWDGGAVLVRASAEAQEAAEQHNHIDIEEKRFEILNNKADAGRVINAVENTLASVFRGSMSNLENLKRMRDILTRMGYDDVEKQELLEAFYREDIVQAALKDNIMNTHNENDIHRHCQRIEYEDEEEFLKCNRRYYQTRGVTLIPLKGKSSIPPAPIIPPSSPPPPPVIEEPEKSES